MYEGIIKSHENDILSYTKDQTTFGSKLAHWDNNTEQVYSKEKKASRIEKKLDQDMSDLVEYTKWMSDETQKLRERVRATESVMTDLKSSGASSVESLMETLYMLKIKQEELESEAQGLRDSINTKELVIKGREEKKAAIKQTIEIENADRENEIYALRKQLEEQKALMDGQTRLLNELQVLCEFTQNDIIKANREL